MVKGFKARLRNRETLIGPLVSITSTEVAEIMSLVGFDYLWIDTEHGPAGFVHAQMMIQAAAGRCACLVRVPENKEVWFKKALDIGCDGVVVPQVRSAAEAERAIEWCLYPPAGKRSVGITRAHDYGMSFQEYVRVVNDELTIVLQVEHADGVRNIESIVDVPGIGAILIGPYDLSGSLNLLGQITHPQVQEAIGEVRRHCERAGVPVGIFAGDAEAAIDAIGQGFTLIALGLDTIYLWKSAKATLDTVRGVQSGQPRP
jgi:2-keto-3-deoxy-L-rhamnonate aldolase RhmA